MPKISVVIPTYNRAQLLSECLESVAVQSFRDFEIVLIDDGSTDNTADIASTFHVRYFWQPNRGPVAAFNKGIELSTGEYISILGSDDSLLEQALYRGMQVLDKHPEVGFSYGQAYLTDEKGSIFGLERPRYKSSYVRSGVEEIRDILVFGHHIIGSTVMIRRSCLKDVGVFALAFGSGSEDVDLWVRLAKKYATAYIAEPLAKFRFHPQKFSHERSLKEWESSNSAILESIFDDAELGPVFHHLRPIAYFRLYCNMAGVAYDRGQMRIARAYLFTALRTHPGALFGSLGFNWVSRLAKTWLPRRILAQAQRLKRYVRNLTLRYRPTHA